MENDYLQNKEPLQTRQWSIRLLVLVGILAGVIMVGVVYMRSLQSDSDPTPSSPVGGVAEDNFNEAVKSATYADYNTAVRLYDTVLNAEGGAEHPDFVSLTKSYALFANGETKQAVGILAGILSAEVSAPATKAWAINALLDFYYKDRSPRVLEEILTQDALSSLRGVPTSTAVFHLAERGDVLYPTSMGKVRLAFYYANELLDATDLGDTEKKAYVAKIIELVDASERLYTEEEHPVASEYQRMLLTHLQGYVLGAAAVGGADAVLFQAKFDQALRDAAEHSSQVIIRQIALYTRFYYAAFLERLALNPEEMERQLVTLVADARDSQTLSQFKDFATVEAARPVDERDHNYFFFERLSARSDAFRELLASIGLSF